MLEQIDYGGWPGSDVMLNSDWPVATQSAQSTAVCRLEVAVDRREEKQSDRNRQREREWQQKRESILIVLR